MASITARLYRPVVHQIGKQLAAADNPDRMRRVFGIAGKLLLPSPGTEKRPNRLGNVDCIRVTPKRQDATRRVLMFHGGGYVFGTPDGYASMAGRLAKAARASVDVADYRLAPEHPYPAAADDALAAYRGLLELNAPENIALFGDSAGGGLVLATLQRARDAGLPMPACAVMLSPWLDLAGTGDSMIDNADTEILVFPKMLERCAAWYAGDTDAREPGISPLFGSHDGLPPLLVQGSANEVLYNDATRFVAQAKKARVDVRMETEPDLWHVWQLMAPGVSEARASLACAAAFIAEHTGGADSA